MYIPSDNRVHDFFLQCPYGYICKKDKVFEQGKEAFRKHTASMSLIMNQNLAKANIDMHNHELLKFLMLIISEFYS